MASPSGDGGRDSELFSSTGAPLVALQYSVAGNWKRKISLTLARVKESFPNIRILIYATNKKIGADGDMVKAECLRDGISLDIRDFSWFSERMNFDDLKFSAAKAFIQVIALPLLEGQKIIEKNRPSLTTMESKAALTYLAMQWEDEQTDKGLSKVVYEALVLSALRNTDSDNRLSRSEIHGIIFGYLTSSLESEVERQVESALKRLTKRKIRHWPADDEYCLTHDEVLRLQKLLLQAQNEETEFHREVEKLTAIEIREDVPEADEMLQDYLCRIVRVLDSFLLKAGEVFASSVTSGEVNSIDKDLLYSTVYSDLTKHPDSVADLTTFPDVALNVVARLCISSNPHVRSHLRKVSDSYTLFAFLRETPDVQKATKKIFGYGKIWLDTTIVLPLLVESFWGDQENGRYSSATSNLVKAGVELRVTDGVVQELLSHIRISQACASCNPSEWQGRVPYLYHSFIQAGYAPASFRSEVERFRGEARPDDDISDYLLSCHGIKVESLEVAAREVEEELRHATERLWREAHGARRNSSDESAGLGGTTEILIRHDVENYLGIISLRRNEQSSELGYKHWWLTTDSVAWKIRSRLKSELRINPSSPLMSLDFLLNSLSFGPARSKLDRTHEQLLPVLLDLDFSAHSPNELLEIADRVRKENGDLPEYLIKRKIRDACDRLKGQFGQATRVAGHADAAH